MSIHDTHATLPTNRKRLTCVSKPRLTQSSNNCPNRASQLSNPRTCVPGRPSRVRAPAPPCVLQNTRRGRLPHLTFTLRRCTYVRVHRDAASGILLDSQQLRNWDLRDGGVVGRSARRTFFVEMKIGSLRQCWVGHSAESDHSLRRLLASSFRRERIGERHMRKLVGGPHAASE